MELTMVELGSITSLLGLGARGEAVKKVQDALSEVRAGELRADGVFGRLTQQAVIRFQKWSRLDADGVVGPATLRILGEAVQHGVRMPLANDDELAARIVAGMRALRYRVDQGDDRIIIPYVEGMDPDGTPNRNEPNKFNDLRTVLRVKQNGDIRMLGKWEGSTEPGRYWTQNPMHPGGAFRIKPGQYYAWRVGQYHGTLALRQAGTISGYRDLNKDYRREGDRLVTGDEFAVHHHGGWNYTHDDMGRSSAGCLVGRSMDGHAEFMELCMSDQEYRRNHNHLFGACVLLANEVPDAAPTS